MQIATWNVNSVRARLDRLLPWLAEDGPDVVCLQETKCQDHQFPLEPIEELGYQVAHFGQKTYNGVAILSRKPIEDVVRGLDDERFDAEARVIGAAVEDFLVLNLYVVNGQEVGAPKYDYKLEWLERVREVVLARYPAEVMSSDKVVLCGDFNITFDDRDVYDPEKWREKFLSSTREREALDSILACGLTDALREFHDEGEIYTWWDFRTRGFQRGNRGLRIDHFLVSQPALQACKGVEVDLDMRGGTKPSDHAPVVATFS